MAANPNPTFPRAQAAVGAGVLLLAALLAAGALRIPGDAGYGGVGPNFLPWVVAAVLGLCGAVLLGQACTGGFRALEADDVPGAARADWPAFAWVAAGLLANATLITTVGFVLSCTLCYLLAAQGLRRAAGQAAGTARVLGTDAVTGFCIAAPVYWMFTKLLAISLPGLTKTGWI